MPKFTLLIAGLLALVAFGFYAGLYAMEGEPPSPTALIPLIPAALFALCGVIGLTGPAARKHAMHVAALLALLGTAGGLGMGLPKLLRWIGGADIARAPAMFEQVLMGLLCLVLLIAAVRSFIAARRARLAGPATVSSP